jgi:hypothetical protein
LGLEIWLDDQCVLDCSHVDSGLHFEHAVPDDEADHTLKFVLKGKTQEHTKIDDAGQIISDARLTIKDLTFDDIELGHMFTEIAVYTHDFNGSGVTTQDKFYGEMGCNGSLSLTFSTPIYLWLLEHM